MGNPQHCATNIYIQFTNMPILGRMQTHKMNTLLYNVLHII